MKILVTGSRRFTDTDLVAACLRRLGATSVVHGGAAGADACAGEAAARLGIPCKVYPADWDKHGKQAGPIRNRAMFKDSSPDCILAFPLPGSIGTWDMVEVGRAAGCRVHVIHSKETSP